jgi:hypothetical protein
VYANRNANNNTQRESKTTQTLNRKGTKHMTHTVNTATVETLTAEVRVLMVGNQEQQT